MSMQVSQVSQVQTALSAGLTDRLEESIEVSEVSGSESHQRRPEITITFPTTIIPDESNRPCFLVLDDWVEDGGHKYRPGVWHFGLKASRKRDDPSTLTQQWVCSSVHVDAVTTDAQAGNYGRLLRFKTTLGKWRTWAMPMELLRGDGSDLRGELLSMGVEIDPQARNLLAMYLQGKAPAKRIQCALQTGWVGSDFRAFVLPDEVIGPGAAKVAYQSGERGQDEYLTAGTLAGWQQGIAAMAVGNPLLMLALSAAFAGPLLARCNSESGGIHFVGDSSTGKTTAIEAACSVWGGPNYKRTWRTTGNGLEGVAALFNDSLLALDEISECDPHDVGAIVYSLGNGRGKQRASRTGSARPVTQWRCSVLSSGERTISTTMEEGGHRIKAGQSMRLLDVPAQRVHGAWDTLHHHANGPTFSDALKREAAINYGHAGRAFLEKITRDHDSNFSKALEEIKALPEFQATSDEGQAKRAGARFASFALAGELATEYGITGWPKEDAIRSAAVAFAAWRNLRGRASASLERDQVAQSVRSFIERHGDSRFSDVQNVDDQHAAIVRERAGWWDDSDCGRRYLFTATGMREALKGFDFSRALDALQEMGAIPAPGADGKRASFRRIHGRGLKLYTTDPGKLDAGGS